jgi:hypothetical protein
MYAISPKYSKLHANGHLQALHVFQDPANSGLIACLQQLWDLRRVGLLFALIAGGNAVYSRFIVGLQQFVREHSLRLESIHKSVYGVLLDEVVWLRGWSQKFTRQVNTRNNLVGWKVESGHGHMPQFVDRW